MFARWKRMAVTLSAAALLNANAVPALAEVHDQSHSHDAAEATRLTLDNGRKWATDDNLRLAMSRIRDALAAELPAIHSGKATAKQYRALAQKADDQIAFMVKNCKLESKADAMLHLVLADIIAGADAMKGKDSNEAHKGAVKIAQALKNYAAFFDHPGWRGL